MTSVLDFRRLEDDQNGQARYSIIRDDKMGPCAYLHVDSGALEIVALMEAAPKLLEALQDMLIAADKIQDDDNGWVFGRSLREQARAVIAKAGAGG